MKVSIIIPAYNEEKRIGKTLRNYSEFFDGVVAKGVLDYEILVVINNTKDRTEEVVKELASKNRRIKYLNLKEGGKGFAVTEGFKEALKRNNDLIGFVDADLATPADQFYRLVISIKQYDAAIANRYDRQSKMFPKNNFRRVIVSRVFNFIVRTLFFFPYHDTQCGAKLFRKKAIERILPDLTITNWAYDINLLHSSKMNGLKIVQVPTEWYEMAGSKIELAKSSLQMLLAIIQLRINRSPFRRLLNPLKPIVGVVWRRVK